MGSEVPYRVWEEGTGVSAVWEGLKAGGEMGSMLHQEMGLSGVAVQQMLGKGARD